MTFLGKIYSASPALTITGWLHAAALIGMLTAALFDHRLILGINPWIKPMKFAASITIFVWTVAWMLSYLPEKHSVIEWGISAAMVIEIVCIAGQAARGVMSHFNQASGLDAAVFAVMGISITFSTVLVARLLWIYCGSVAMPPAVLWGVRLGLAIFLAGSLDGFLMVAHKAHTVGLADGGAGLPLVNWSTRAGDLRIAHFLGLHAMQALPLAGWYFDRVWPSRAMAAVFGLSACVVAIFAITLLQALSGRPLIAR